MPDYMLLLRGTYHVERRLSPAEMEAMMGRFTTFLSTGLALSDGGTACTGYGQPYTIPATRLEVVGVDQQPIPPLLLSRQVSPAAGR